MIEDQISLETVLTLGDWPDKPNFARTLACFPLLPDMIHPNEYGETKFPSIIALPLVYTGHSSGCLLPCNTRFVFLCYMQQDTTGAPLVTTAEVVLKEAGRRWWWVWWPSANRWLTAKLPPLKTHHYSVLLHALVYSTWLIHIWLGARMAQNHPMVHSNENCGFLLHHIHITPISHRQERLMTSVQTCPTIIRSKIWI